MIQSPFSLLLPRPRTVASTNAHLALSDHPVIDVSSAPPGLRATAEALAETLVACGCRPRWAAAAESRSAETTVTLRIEPASLPHRQGYTLTIGETGVAVIGADEAGLFYGICTLNQLIHLHARPARTPRRTLPGCHITDWPDFPHRGVLLDVSRDKVPTMQTLYGLVEMLAGWKINQLQLYMEHTFAYRGHEIVWRDASPFTGEEIRALDAFCQARHVELVPNQNSLGHMHRWLIHDPYRHLAECPDGIAHPFSVRPEPYGLCPTDPDSLAFLADLYAQLLPHFSSRQVNVGLDETLDLGQGRSAPLCAARGKASIYSDFLQGVHRLVVGHGRVMQCWSDMLRQWPELIDEIPKDVIILEWGYEADHPFLEHCRRFAAAGLRVYVCPGTSSWNSLAGRATNALLNIHSAATAGRATGAIGVLTTDWGDNGHLQPLPVSYPGFVAGAAAGWHSAQGDQDHAQYVAACVALHAFQDQAGVMGDLTCELGNVHRHTSVHLSNASILFHLLLLADRPLPEVARRRLSVQNLEETHATIDKIAASLVGARMARPDAETVQTELRWVADMLRLACRLGIARLTAGHDAPLSTIPRQIRTAIRDELRTLTDRHRELWRRRNRPGGLRDSAARLDRIAALLDT